MPTLTILKDTCQYCGKVAKEAKHESYPELGLSITTLQCGHTIIKEIARPEEEQKRYIIHSVNGKKTLYPYQQEGVKFAEQANGRVLIADEMGLGKTIQALGFIKLRAPECLPVLIICKSSLILQWIREILEWLGPEFMPCLITKGTDRPLEGFPIYLISFDLIRRVTGRSRKKASQILTGVNAGLSNWNAEENENALASFPFKTIIIDETQQIKNSNSIRTQEVRKICAPIKSDTGEIIPRDYILGLSGTPAKNNAGEMFSILNIINPTRFPEYRNFCLKFCDQFWTGYRYKIAGIKDLEYFKEHVADMMIRRERADVLPELPAVSRVFFNVPMLGKKIRDAYIAAQKEFEDEYDDYEDKSKRVDFTSVIAKMSKLRHLAGLAKVESCAEQVIQFLESTDRKIIVFTHHIDVAGTLEVLVNRWILGERESDEQDEEDETEREKLSPVINLVGKTGSARDNAVDKFREDKSCRVLIASTLASGEGLNLQYISDCIMLERQWNPANEEQAEARFPRPGRRCNKCGGEINKKQMCLSCGEQDKVDAKYFIAAGTIDEILTEMVEQKREWIQSIHKETDYTWDESSLMKELAKVLHEGGMKKFKLSQVA